MVNRIDGNNYYDYQKLKNVNIPDSGEKFSLDYKQNGLQSEAKEDKDKNDKAAEQSLSADKSGVKLELSGQGRSAAGRGMANTVPKSEAKAGSQSLVDTIRTYVLAAVEAVKGFFYKIWNDPQPESADAGDILKSERAGEAISETPELEQAEAASTVEGSETAEYSDIDARTAINAQASQYADIDAETAYRIDVEKRHREIQPYLRKGDINQVINLLTDDGRKTIARNSSLLTYYDKNGRMVEPNASDRERILHGDGNVRKL